MQPQNVQATNAAALTATATKATCDTATAQAKTDIATTGRTSQPATCAYGEILPYKAATPSAAPPTCATPADGRWWGIDGKRRSACLQGGQLGWVVTRTSDGVVTGRGALTADVTMYEPDNSFPQWFTDSTYALDLTVTTGTGFPSAVTGGLGACTATSAIQCQAGSTFRTVTPDNVWAGSGNEIVTILNAKNFVQPLNDGWNVVVAGAWSNPLTFHVPMAPNRCDNFFAGANCVLTFVPGVWAVPTAKVRTFAEHISGAMQSGLPGNVQSNVPLHRQTDQTLIDANRARACPFGRYPRPTPPGYQCDEFPFASTTEGAKTTPYQGPARTQPQCQMPQDSTTKTGINGFSRCYITELDNSRAGGLEGAWFGRERIADGDPFKLGFDNTGA